MKAVALNTWAGRRYYPVEVISETPSRFRVRSLYRTWFFLPGKRRVEPEDVFLVPKHAVCDVDQSKLEYDPYCGHIDGYGGEVDARE